MMCGNGAFRIGTHYCAAHLVDDAPARVYCLSTVRLNLSTYPPAHRLDDLRESLLHVRSLARLVL